MTDDEEITGRLLRLAGPRPEVPADRAVRVRNAVHRQWQLDTRRRMSHRRVLLGAVGLAAAATLVLVVRVRPPRDAVSHVEALASIEQVIGQRIDRNGGGQLTQGRAIRTGEWVETGGARAALRLTSGASVRLDTGTRARLLSLSIIELTRGAVYLDTGANSTGVEVRTPLGVAHDIGTQFEVRLTDSALRVRVRTGLVELRTGARAVAARPGTEVTLASGDAVTKPIAAFGPEWAWAVRLAPAFDTEKQPLAAFLEYMAREQGWTLRYGDAQLARDASGIILHGSLGGLEPRDAVAAAVRTSGLSYHLDDGELVVMRTDRK